jgi:hypothetical protein
MEPRYLANRERELLYRARELTIFVRYALGLLP